MPDEINLLILRQSALVWIKIRRKGPMDGRKETRDFWIRDKCGGRCIHVVQLTHNADPTSNVESLITVISISGRTVNVPKSSLD